MTDKIVYVMSPYIIAIVVAWVIANTIKFIVRKIKGVKQDVEIVLFSSGGMPSAHTATSVALLTIVGLKDGVESAIFGVALLFCLIVMYDATEVRRSCGEQGRAIHAIIKEMKINIKKPLVAMGHTPLEVLVGAVLGLAIGMIVFLVNI